MSIRTITMSWDKPAPSAGELLKLLAIADAADDEGNARRKLARSVKAKISASQRLARDYAKLRGEK
ncbi:hypothetical protein [Hydrogenophaga sp. BPS33]|uniref:hypothetical protein n=1 Tax=Hydrogenophaga sp. BPS33 TaxID=2651974 RepID=UPI00131FE217|nr:hypothetical protein [Hydrogenophaga sp. BPS33]QHE86319.1 hypothetical protein F9K07_16110 [Hydrogenophaga sp. BPS33]